MKRLLFALILLTLSATLSVAQDAAPSDCPADKVCITREAAIKAVETAKERDALKIELASKDQAFEDLRKELNEMRIKFATASGENTALKQNAVQDRAIIDLLLKNVKPRKIGLIVF